MFKTIKKIFINTEEIDVIYDTNGISNITQLNLESNENEIDDIFDKYNIEGLTIYPYDMNIVRGLAENGEQLKDYLETCRRNSFSKEKVEVPESIPEILYDLKDLRTVEMEQTKKLELYKQANETKELLKKARGRVCIKINIFDKAYFAIQELLNSQTTKLLLNSGVEEAEKKKITSRS